MQIAKCDSMQRRLLLNVVRRAKRSDFGKEHDFQLIRSIEDFQKHVPLHTPKSFRMYLKNRSRSLFQALVPVKDVVSRDSISISLGKKGNLLSLDKHFFEFMKLKDLGKACAGVELAHKVKKGTYAMFITNNHGLYRYRVDNVKVLGKTAESPRIKFLK